MTNEFAKDVITAATVTRLPQYTDKKFMKFVQLTPDADRESGKVVGFSEGYLDAVNLAWRESEETRAMLMRLRSAIDLPGVPDLEAQEAKTIYEKAQQTNNEVVWGIDLALKSTKELQWSSVREIALDVNKFNERKAFCEQVVAFCEAIDGARELGLS